MLFFDAHREWALAHATVATPLAEPLNGGVPFCVMMMSV